MDVGCRRAEPVAEVLVALERVLVATVRIPASIIEVIGSVVTGGRIGERIVRCEFQANGIQLVCRDDVGRERSSCSGGGGGVRIVDDLPCSAFGETLGEVPHALQRRRNAKSGVRAILLPVSLRGDKEESPVVPIV